MPHRYAVAAITGVGAGLAGTDASLAETADARAARSAGNAAAATRRGPAVRTLMDGPSNETSTVPSVSVRYVARAIAWSRSMVAGAGCPYGLPSPDETTAKRGRTASRNAGVLDVREP